MTSRSGTFLVTDVTPCWWHQAWAQPEGGTVLRAVAYATEFGRALSERFEHLAVSPEGLKLELRVGFDEDSGKIERRADELRQLLDEMAPADARAAGMQ